MIAGAKALEHSDHIRKLDLSKDLDQVADLIEMCFPIHSDPDGQSYVRDMRKAAQDMRLLGWLNSLADLGSQKSAGFVWEEDGRILGNLSLIPFQEEGRRIHLIANVAVHPDYRRKGIARALTSQALDHLRRRGDRDTWLQVRDDNPAAINLYRTAGFTEKDVRTTWRIRPFEFQHLDLPEVPPFKFRKRGKEDWERQQSWMAQAYPRKIRWNLPVDFTRFTPGPLQGFMNFLDGIRLRHWVLESGGECIGVITWQKTSSFADNLWLAYPEAQEEQWLPVALGRVFKRLVSQHHALSVDYPKGRFETHFEALGFKRFRTLIWMRCRLT